MDPPPFLFPEASLSDGPPAANPFAFQPAGPSLHDVPFSERWELVKTAIVRLYVVEKRRLSEVIRIMKEQYRFDAAEHQYKHQFKKWGLKKNIPSAKKESISELIQNRTRLGGSIVVKYKDQQVEARKMQRYLKSQSKRDLTLHNTEAVRRDKNSLPLAGSQLGYRIFQNWNLPYKALVASIAGAVDPISPFGVVSTPSDVLAASPGTGAAAFSPSNAFSSTSVVVRTKAANDMARLFVEGRHEDLLRSMDTDDKRTLSTWLYQFWLFSFKTAKHWGRGPRDWTASLLQVEKYRDLASGSLPNTPGTATGIPDNHTTSNDSRTQDKDLSGDSPKPSSLCRWSIRTQYVDYEAIPSPNPSTPSTVDDPGDERGWKDWPADDHHTQFADKLRNGLETNDFSNVRANKLPMALSQIVRAVRRSPEELLEEAFGFSIMSRNLELMQDLMKKIRQSKTDVGGLHPFHLATSYLDGSKYCCDIFYNLFSFLPRRGLPPRTLYVNDLGHTVLDNLMMSILKSHTSCLPGVVDTTFRKDKRFVGEEVDICGRWDADSDCVRTLLGRGIPTIPFEWKHMFCHTSVQVICHCISTIFQSGWSPDIDAPSGLFLKRCESCGLKLQPRPLHTLVMIAFHLARSGCEGETLFGMLACLLCLLRNGANPLLKADISLQALLDTQWSDECSHKEMDPYELSQKVPNEIILSWSNDLRTGWRLFGLVLRMAQEQWDPDLVNRQPHPSPEPLQDDFAAFVNLDQDETIIDNIEDASQEDIDVDEDIETGPRFRYCKECEEEESFFGGSRDLSTLWAAVQIELLTYRRLQEGDPWTSLNFNMHTLLEGLISRTGVCIGLVEKGMISEFCKCGNFYKALGFICVCAEEASAYYFSNLEDWNRSHFIYPRDD